MGGGNAPSRYQFCPQAFALTMLVSWFQCLVHRVMSTDFSKNLSQQLVAFMRLRKSGNSDSKYSLKTLCTLKKCSLSIPAQSILTTRSLQIGLWKSSRLATL